MMTDGAVPPTDRGERDFDAFLDALVSKAGEPFEGRHVADSPLAEAARRFHAMAARDSSTPPASTLHSIREDVMGTPQGSASMTVSAARRRLGTANGAVPRAMIAPPRQPAMRPAWSRPRWLLANASLAAIVLLTVGLGLVAYRVGPGGPPRSGSDGPAGFVVGSPAVSNDVPHPKECRVEPRTVEEVAALFATPSSNDSNRLLVPISPPMTIDGPDVRRGTPVVNEPPAAVTVTPLPGIEGDIATIPALTETPETTFAIVPPALLNGPPADPEAVAAVTATWREYIACLNAGDYFRITALFSDAGFRRTFVQGNPPPSADELGTVPRGGFIPVEERIPYEPLREVCILPDGRVGAMVAVDGTSGMDLKGGNRVIFMMIFVKEGDRWLIDELAVSIE